jgi:hypothetical protein
MFKTHAVPLPLHDEVGGGGGTAVSAAETGTFQNSLLV